MVPDFDRRRFLAWASGIGAIGLGYRYREGLRRWLRPVPGTPGSIVGFRRLPGASTDVADRHLESGYDGLTGHDVVESFGQADVEYVDPSDGYDGLVETLADLGDRPGIVRIDDGLIDGIDDNVTVPSNTWLCGAGTASTSLKFADSVSMDVSGLIRIEGDNVVVSDLELDGNREEVSLGEENNGQEYGVYVAGRRAVVVERLYCHHFPGYGIDPHPSDGEPAREITITSCLTTHNGLDGITVAGVVDGLVRNSRSLENSRHGINLTNEEGTAVTVMENTVSRNGGDGVVVQNEFDEVTIRHNDVRSNGRAGIRLGTGGATSTGIDVLENRIRNNETYGINARRAREVFISENRLRRNGADGDTSAEIVVRGDGERFSRAVTVSENELHCRSETEHGIEEREGSGPTAVVENVIYGSSEPIATSHEDSSERENRSV